ncbi:MAG: gamma-butyrobetaine hydroxylase-like domain-containing protein [Pseudomonadota bacterium]
MKTQPQEIKLLQKQRMLFIDFGTEQFELSCEYLRINSPSAEVRGHGMDNTQKPKPASGKSNVNIISIEPVGNYAVKLIFDDGHHTGIYSWDYLYEIACNQPKVDP